MQGADDHAIWVGPPLQAAGIDTDLDLLTLLRTQVAAHGQRTLTVVNGTGDTGQALTYASLWHRAGCIHQGLLRRQTRPGHRLIIAVSELGDLIATLWACWLAGAVPLALPLTASRLENWRRDLERSLAVLKPKRRFRGLVIDRYTAAAGEHPEPGTLLLEHLKDEPPNFSGAPVAGHRPGALFSSSGSTGVPKLILLSRQALAVRLQYGRMPDKAGCAAPERCLFWLPAHQAGTCLRVMTPDGLPKTILSTDAFVGDPACWFELIEQHRISTSMMTSFGMGLLLRTAARNPDRAWDLSSLNALGIGAEPISSHTLHHFIALIRRFGAEPDRIVTGYGMTEAGTVTSGTANLATAEAGRTGSGAVGVGSPLPGYAVRVIRPDRRVCSMGETGEIEIRSPSAALRYLGRSHQDPPLHRADGWMRTGDLGFLEGPNLTVTGRQQDVVMMNARSHSCQAIEQTLQGLLPCREGEIVACAVHTDADATEALVLIFDAAALVPGGAANSDDPADRQCVAAQLRRHLLQSMGLVARDIVGMDGQAIPRTASGKVQRSALAQLWLAQQAEARGPDPAEVPQPPHAARAAADHKGRLSPTEALLLELWQNQFPHQNLGLHDDFFSLGGDSIAAVALLEAIERRTGHRLRLASLAALSTIADLAARLDAEPSGIPAEAQAGAAPRAELQLRRFLSGWPGARRRHDSLVVCQRSAGSGMPLFWCCQGHQELVALAEAIGEGHPVYGMRSLHLIAPPEGPEASTIASLYADDIAELAAGSRIALGGNCQGSYMALACARALLRRGHTVGHLFLLEHHRPSFYPGRVTLLHGNDAMSDPFARFLNPELGWSTIYPAGFSTSRIHCPHGHFFQPANAARLAAVITATLASTSADAPDPACFSAAGQAPADSSPMAAGVSLTLTAPVPAAGQPHPGGTAWPLAVRVDNRSSRCWGPTAVDGVRLGAQVVDPDGAPLRLALSGAELLEPLAAGETREFSLRLAMPPAPGPVRVTLDLVQEGVTWFRDRGGVPLQLDLEPQRRRSQTRAPEQPTW